MKSHIEKLDILHSTILGLLYTQQYKLFVLALPVDIFPKNCKTDLWCSR